MTSPIRTLLLVAASVSALLSAARTASAQTVWTGGSGLNPWSNPANWTGTAPTDNASLDLVFGAVGATNITTNSNDLSGLTATSITFNGNSFGYTLNGNQITLGGDIFNTGGSNTIALPLLLSATRTIDVTGNNLGITRVVSGTGGIVKTGGSTLGLDAVNTYTGPTTIESGFVQVQNLANGGSSSSLGASSSDAANLVLNGGTLVYTSGTTATTDRLFTLGGPATINANSGSLNFTNTGPIVVSGADVARTLTLRAGSGTSTFAPQIVNGAGSQTVSINKVGSGTWEFTNANTYSGPTTVNEGTLLVNNATGSGTGTGTVLANNGAATLGGSGTIGGAVTIGNGGTIRGGDANGVGTLTIQNGLTLNASARVGFRVTDGSTPSATPGGSSTGGTTTPTSNNFIHVTTGGLTFIPAAIATYHFEIDGTGTTFTPGQEYSYRVGQILTSVGTPQDLSGLVLSGPGVQGLFTANGFDANTFSLTGDANGFLYAGFTPVPEPATILGLSAAAVGFGGFLRRRKGRDCPAMAV